MANVDWKKAMSGGSYEDDTIFEDGIYKCECKEVKKTKSGEWLIFRSEILECEQYPDAVGKTVSLLTKLTEEAIFKTVNFIHGCGIEVDLLPACDTEGEAFLKIVKACEGRQIILHLQPWNGKNSFDHMDTRRVDEQPLIESINLDAEDEDMPDFMTEDDD